MMSNTGVVVPPLPNLDLSSAASSVVNAFTAITPAQAITAGVVALTTMTYFTYRKIEEDALKRRKAKVLEVKKLELRHLKKFRPTGRPTAPEISMADVFKQNDPNKPDQYEVIDFDESTFDDLLSINPSFGDARLYNYSDIIKNAMTVIYEYYEDRFNRFFNRGEPDDITSGVLRHMLMMLSEHCINFEAHDINITILEHIRGYIQDYASLKPHGPRFQHLTMVNLLLEDATKILIRHKSAFSIGQAIQEFLPQCKTLINKMIINHAKLVSPEKDWAKIKFTFPRRLVQGIIKPGINEHWGAHPSKINIDTSLFKSDLITLAENYLCALDIENRDPDKLRQLRFFEIRDLAELNIDDLKDFEDYIEDHPNFFTLTAVEQSKSAVDKRVPITSENDKIDCFNGIIKHAGLIARLIEVYGFTAPLTRYIRNEGEEHFANPNNSHFLFDALLAFAQQNSAKAQELRKLSHDLSLFKKKFMLEGAQGDLFDNVMATVLQIENDTLTLIRSFASERVNHQRILDEIDVDSHMLVKWANNIINKNNLQLRVQPRVISSRQSTPQPPATHAPSSFTNELFIPASIARQQPLHSIAEEEKYPSSAEALSHPVVNPGQVLSEDEVFYHYRQISIEDLDLILKLINERIEEIRITENNPPHIGVYYQKLYEALQEMRYQSVAHFLEKDETRHDKASKTKQLTYHMCLYTLNYLKMDLSHRRDDENIYIDRMRKIFNVDDPRNEFIRTRKTGTTAFFNNPTSTEKGVEHVARAVNNLRGILQHSLMTGVAPEHRDAARRIKESLRL